MTLLLPPRYAAQPLLIAWSWFAVACGQGADPRTLTPGSPPESESPPLSKELTWLAISEGLTEVGAIASEGDREIVLSRAQPLRLSVDDVSYAEQRDCNEIGGGAVSITLRTVSRSHSRIAHDGTELVIDHSLVSDGARIWRPLRTDEAGRRLECSGGRALIEASDLPVRLDTSLARSGAERVTRTDTGPGRGVSERSQYGYQFEGEAEGEVTLLGLRHDVNSVGLEKQVWAHSRHRSVSDPGRGGDVVRHSVTVEIGRAAEPLKILAHGAHGGFVTRREVAAGQARIMALGAVITLDFSSLSYTIGSEGDCTADGGSVAVATEGTSLDPPSFRISCDTLGCYASSGVEGVRGPAINVPCPG